MRHGKNTIKLGEINATLRGLKNLARHSLLGRTNVVLGPAANRNPQWRSVLARSCSSATPQRSFLAATPDVFGAGLGCHLRLALDHAADLLDDLGVGKSNDVANVHGGWRWRPAPGACFAWLGRNRRVSNDYEYRVQTSETMIDLAAIRLMLQPDGPCMRLLKHPLTMDALRGGARAHFAERIKCKIRPRLRC